MWGLHFVIGTLCGSFVQCIAERNNEGRAWGMERSCCDTCQHVLDWWMMIPVLSYLCLRGKCPYCKAQIPSRYVWMEVGMGICGIFCGIGSTNWLLFGQWMGLLTICIAVSYTDQKCGIIPDSFLWIGILWRIFYLLLQEGLSMHCLYAICNSVVGAGIFLFSAIVVEKFKKEDVVGGGDIKLLFMIGLYLGLFATMQCLFIASAVGLVFAKIQRKNRIRFGPFFTIGVFCILLMNCIIM